MAYGYGNPRSKHKMTYLDRGRRNKRKRKKKMSYHSSHKSSHNPDGKKYGPKAAGKIETTMREFHAGKLTTRGRKVTDVGQAKAIAIAQARSAGMKVPPPPRR